MTHETSSLIATLVQAMNDHDSDAFIAGFAKHAVVRDEGKDHRGLPAIKTWIENTIRKYQLRFEITQITERGNETVFRARVFGAFEGSPGNFEHRLTVENGRITAWTNRLL